MNVLVIDIGGTQVKLAATGHADVRRMASGPALSAAQMVEGVQALAEGWDYDAVAIGYPGVVVRDQPVTEPRNLAPGWVKFDYAAAFGKPVKMLNDAAMQALGSYQGGKLLFLGLGTGMGSTLIVDGTIVPMELAHLPYRKATFEDYVGKRALERDGEQKWRRRVADVVAQLAAALVPDEVVIGGGNVKRLGPMPPGCRAGANANAFVGGFRLWEAGATAHKRAAKKRRPAAKRAAEGGA